MRIGVMPDATRLDNRLDDLDRTTGRQFKLGMGCGLHCEHTPLGVDDRTLFGHVLGRLESSPDQARREARRAPWGSCSHPPPRRGCPPPLVLRSG